MDETHQLPLCDERRLALGDTAKKCKVGLFGGSRRRVVPGDGVVGECPQRIVIAPAGEELEGAHPDVAPRNPREHRAWEQPLSDDLLACGHGRECPCRRHAKAGHGLTDNILSYHGANTGSPVAAAREWRGSRSLQLYVAADAVPSDDFAKQNGPPIAQLRHPVSELEAGVRHGQRLGVLRYLISTEHGDALRRAERHGIETKFVRQRLIELHELGVGDGCWRHVREKALRESRVAVLEREVRVVCGGDWHVGVQGLYQAPGGNHGSVLRLSG